MSTAKGNVVWQNKQEPRNGYQGSGRTRTQSLGQSRLYCGTESSFAVSPHGGHPEPDSPRDVAPVGNNTTRFLSVFEAEEDRSFAALPLLTSGSSVHSAPKHQCIAYGDRIVAAHCDSCTVVGIGHEIPSLTVWQTPDQEKKEHYQAESSPHRTRLLRASGGYSLGLHTSKSLERQTDGDEGLGRMEVNRLIGILVD